MESCGGGWGGGMLTFLELAHMPDATECIARSCASLNVAALDSEYDSLQYLKVL